MNFPRWPSFTSKDIESVSKVLTLPDKDFLFDVRVKGFRYKMNEGDYEVQHIWAAYIEFNLNADYGDGELTNLTNENFEIQNLSLYF